MGVRENPLAGIAREHRRADALGDVSECRARAHVLPPTNINGRRARARRSAASSIAAGSGIGRDGVRRVRDWSRPTPQHVPRQRQMHRARSAAAENTIGAGDELRDSSHSGPWR